MSVKLKESVRAFGLRVGDKETPLDIVLSPNIHEVLQLTINYLKDRYTRDGLAIFEPLFESQVLRDLVDYLLILDGLDKQSGVTIKDILEFIYEIASFLQKDQKNVIINQYKLVEIFLTKTAAGEYHSDIDTLFKKVILYLVDMSVSEDCLKSLETPDGPIKKVIEPILNDALSNPAEFFASKQNNSRQLQFAMDYIMKTFLFYQTVECNKQCKFYLKSFIIFLKPANKPIVSYFSKKTPANMTTNRNFVYNDIFVIKALQFFKLFIDIDFHTHLRNYIRKELRLGNQIMKVLNVADNTNSPKIKLECFALIHLLYQYSDTHYVERFELKPLRSQLEPFLKHSLAAYKNHVTLLKINDFSYMISCALWLIPPREFAPLFYETVQIVSNLDSNTSEQLDSFSTGMLGNIARVIIINAEDMDSFIESTKHTFRIFHHIIDYVKDEILDLVKKKQIFVLEPYRSDHRLDHICLGLIHDILITINTTTKKNKENKHRYSVQMYSNKRLFYRELTIASEWLRFVSGLESSSRFATSLQSENTAVFSHILADALQDVAQLDHSDMAVVLQFLQELFTLMGIQITKPMFSKILPLLDTDDEHILKMTLNWIFYSASSNGLGCSSGFIPSKTFIKDFVEEQELIIKLYTIATSENCILANLALQCLEKLAFNNGEQPEGAVLDLYYDMDIIGIVIEPFMKNKIFQEHHLLALSILNSLSRPARFHQYIIESRYLESLAKAVLTADYLLEDSLMVFSNFLVEADKSTLIYCRDTLEIELIIEHISSLFLNNPFHKDQEPILDAYFLFLQVYFQDQLLQLKEIQIKPQNLSNLLNIIKLVISSSLTVSTITSTITVLDFLTSVVLTPEILLDDLYLTQLSNLYNSYVCVSKNSYHYETLQRLVYIFLQIYKCSPLAFERLVQYKVFETTASLLNDFKITLDTKINMWELFQTVLLSSSAIKEEKSIPNLFMGLLKSRLVDPRETFKSYIYIASPIALHGQEIPERRQVLKYIVSTLIALFESGQEGKVFVSNLDVKSHLSKVFVDIFGEKELYEMAKTLHESLN